MSFVNVGCELNALNCRGQCYDGASTMSGERSVVTAQIKDINKKCLFTHCYGHERNCAVKEICNT